MNTTQDTKERVQPYCDWWLPSRAKCPKPGTEVTADKYGAPLRFCREHRKLASYQYPMAMERPFSGFPPIVEQDLPEVSVENVDRPHPRDGS